jgi:hypothetical protein
MQPEKDATAFTSLPFDFVATGLRNIQFLFSLYLVVQIAVTRAAVSFF